VAGLLDPSQPDHRQPGPVDKERDAFQVAHANEVGAVLDQRDEIQALGFGPLALADVSCGLGRTDDLARLILDGQMKSTILALPSATAGQLGPKQLARRCLVDPALVASINPGDVLH
jgi:hypothetical protein